MSVEYYLPASAGQNVRTQVRADILRHAMFVLYVCKSARGITGIGILHTALGGLCTKKIWLIKHNFEILFQGLCATIARAHAGYVLIPPIPNPIIYL